MQPDLSGFSVSGHTENSEPLEYSEKLESLECESHCVLWLTAALFCIQGATAYAPQIALRFDYSQTIGSPLISIYYTDRMGAADQGGLPLPNLAQTFNLNLNVTHP